jgi:hypothetical protein
MLPVCLSPRLLSPDVGADSGAAAWRFARECTWDPSHKRINWPKIASQMVDDTTRTKSKKVCTAAALFCCRSSSPLIPSRLLRSAQVYEGTFEGCLLRVSVSEVKEESGSHVQVGGGVPAFQEAIKAGAALPLQPLRALIAFCEDLKRASRV